MLVIVVDERPIVNEPPGLQKYQKTIEHEDAEIIERAEALLLVNEAL